MSNFEVAFIVVFVGASIFFFAENALNAYKVYSEMKQVAFGWKAKARTAFQLFKACFYSTCALVALYAWFAFVLS